MLFMLAVDPQESCRWGGRGRGGVDRQSTWKGSAKTLQGLPLTMFIYPGGGVIDGQLGKDLQRHCVTGRM